MTLVFGRAGNQVSGVRRFRFTRNARVEAPTLKELFPGKNVPGLRKTVFSDTCVWVENWVGGVFVFRFMRNVLTVEEVEATFPKLRNQLWGQTFKGYVQQKLSNGAVRSLRS